MHLSPTERLMHSSESKTVRSSLFVRISDRKAFDFQNEIQKEPITKTNKKANNSLHIALNSEGLAFLGQKALGAPDMKGERYDI